MSAPWVDQLHQGCSVHPPCPWRPSPTAGSTAPTTTATVHRHFALCQRLATSVWCRWGYNVFPIEIATSAQRPDIVIYSLSLRKVILIELTVPLEDRVATAHTIKTTGYASRLSARESNGFGVFHFPVEVGSRGFVARSLLDCLRQLGFPPVLRRKVRNECSRVALRSSYIIYLRRAIDLWRDMSSLTWKGLQNSSAVSLAQFLRWSYAFLQLVSPRSLYKYEVLLHSGHMV